MTTADTAIYRLASECPLCGGPLRLCRNRQDESLFLGCSAYPACHFAEAYDVVLQETLAALATKPKQRQRKQRGKSSTLIERQLAATRHQLVTLQEEHRALQRRYATTLSAYRALRAKCDGMDQEALLRRIKTLLLTCHPDRWGGDNPVATELTKGLLALRDDIRGHELW